MVGFISRHPAIASVIVFILLLMVFIMTMFSSCSNMATGLLSSVVGSSYTSEDKDIDRQLDALKKYGVDHIYHEKMTGTKKYRPELTKLLRRMTSGDVVAVADLSRLGRITNDLIELTELFHSRGVNLVLLKESIDTNTSTDKLLFTLMSAIAQFERDCIADRTRDGLHSAKARGRTGGRPKINADSIKKAVVLYHTGQYSLHKIEGLTGDKKSTLYRNLKDVLM